MFVHIFICSATICKEILIAFYICCLCPCLSHWLRTRKIICKKWNRITWNPVCISGDISQRAQLKSHKLFFCLKKTRARYGTKSVALDNNFLTFCSGSRIQPRRIYSYSFECALCASDSCIIIEMDSRENVDNSKGEKSVLPQRQQQIIFEIMTPSPNKHFNHVI